MPPTMPPTVPPTTAPTVPTTTPPVLSAVVLSAALFASACQGPQNVDPGPSAGPASDEADEAAAAIEAALADSPLRDAVVWIGHADGTDRLWRKGDGHEDRLYFADSAQKWTVATVLLREVRALGLDSTAALRALPHASRFVGHTDGAAGDTTVAQTLSFMAGFEDPPLCASVAAGDLHDCAGAIFDSGQTTPIRYHYGTHAMMVTASLLTDDDESYATLFQRFQDDTGLFGDAVYGSAEKPLRLETSATSYRAFLLALLDDDSGLLHVDDRAAMFEDHVGDAAISSSPASGMDGEWRYGLGNWVRCDDGACGSQRHSAGARGFYPWIDLERRTYGLIVHNAAVGDWQESHALYEDIVDLIPVALDLDPS